MQTTGNAAGTVICLFSVAFFYAQIRGNLRPKEFPLRILLIWERVAIGLQPHSWKSFYPFLNHSHFRYTISM